ncbi:MAG: T9SS type A sorting domain-containing protein [Gemmatimonadetes bacterium]|nr:T9SS type A sorting domain-containing protein [Gemmatimonadota bacterium]
MRRIPWTLALFCWAAAPCAAETWLVPSQAPTVAAGLDSAAAGDTVLVACGTYFESGLVLPPGVTLRSSTGLPGCAVLDGGGLARVLEVSGTGAETRIEGFTIQGGQAPAGASAFVQSGGALRADSSDVSVTDCLFRQNGARFGAAAAVWWGSPTFLRCDFDSNAAFDTPWATGGGLYSEDASPTLSFCTFTDNTAFAVDLPGDGGGVFAKRSTVLARDCTFTGNASGAGAGAFYSFFFDTSILDRCTFTANTSDAGGAMYIENSTPLMRDCSFDANVGVNGGAAFIGEFSSPTFRSCSFDSNQAVPNSGGAIDCWFSTGDFTDCDFVGNTAGLRGGAVSINTTSGPTFTDCLFADNTAQNGGAVRLASTGTAVLTTCNLVGNTATTQGGGILAEGSSLVLVDRSIIAFSPAGAAVECTGSGSVSLTDSDLFGNAGGDWVGCVASQAATGGNFSADPEFCDAAGGDYSLTLPSSPCLAENHSGGERIGPEAGGCGCPTGATVFVPDDHATVAAAVAASVPGDVVGVCSGSYAETIVPASGIHVRGVRNDLVTFTPGGVPDAVLHAVGVADSTVVSDLTLDGLSTVTQVVLAESLSTGLHLRSTRITGGVATGVTNGSDSRVTLGGTLAWANDLFANGGAVPHHVHNLNVTADSLPATLNYWGTTRYDSILAAVTGPVRTCPITNAAHDDSLCAPVSAVGVTPLAERNGLRLAVRPNPVRESAELVWALPRPGRVSLAVHDVTGRRVARLQDGPAGAGVHRRTWAGTDSRGRPVAPGVYFLRLEALGEVRTRKIVRIR